MTDCCYYSPSLPAQVHTDQPERSRSDAGWRWASFCQPHPRDTKKTRRGPPQRTFTEEPSTVFTFKQQSRHFLYAERKRQQHVGFTGGVLDTQTQLVCGLHRERRSEDGSRTLSAHLCVVIEQREHHAKHMRIVLRPHDVESLHRGFTSPFNALCEPGPSVYSVPLAHA